MMGVVCYTHFSTDYWTPTLITVKKVGFGFLCLVSPRTLGVGFVSGCICKTGSSGRWSSWWTIPIPSFWMKTVLQSPMCTPIVEWFGWDAQLSSTGWLDVQPKIFQQL
jgi:hypothetical protein